MNKKGQVLIVVIVLIVIALIIGGIWLYYAHNTSGKCGDGVCDAKEKAKGICPKDCGAVNGGGTNNNGGNNENLNITASAENPFVISMAGFLGDDYISSLDYMKEAGATGVRFMSRWGGMHWDQAEPKKGVFDWSSSDAQYLAAKQRGLNIMVTIYPGSPSWDNPNAQYANEYPTDMDEYLKFVKMAAERYDGDGVDDAPGSPVVSTWILMEEIERGDEQKWWGGTPQQYADLFVKTYYAIKSANPNAVVMTYGANNFHSIETGTIETVTKPAFIELNRLTSGKTDFSFVYSMHYYHTENLANYISNIDYTKNMLAGIGFENNEIVMEDMAPFISKDDPEREQKVAKQIVTSHVISFAKGLKTVGWAQLSDGFDYANNFEAGIISNPTMSNAGNSNKFRNLGFYSYQLMTQKLSGSDLNNVQTIQESNGIYIYKFMKQGKPVWVAWSNSAGSATISDINSQQVGITNAVPNTDSVDFNTQNKAVSNGAVMLSLSDVPVYVEEI